jgi:nucleotide-binding universal stress UspA family protein
LHRLLDCRASRWWQVIRSSIPDAIASFQPDLLAMGTHARSGIAIAMIGSLARTFLVEAPCDVLVARA